MIKQVLTALPGYDMARRMTRKTRNARQVAHWELSGRPVPPPHAIKERVILEYQERYGIKIFVETGTYRGDMVAAVTDAFERIYSIELSYELWAAARSRFRNEKHIEIIRGDSGVELRWLLHRIERPALFWLDGHYSAGVTAKGDKVTPIFAELGHILDQQSFSHVILIDDARCFGVEQGYPQMEELREFIKGRRGDLKISVEWDCIRIEDPRAAIQS